jgi:hypothetical protein
MAITKTPLTIVLFLFTPQNYPLSIPATPEFGKMQLRIEEIPLFGFPDDLTTLAFG